MITLIGLYLVSAIFQYVQQYLMAGVAQRTVYAIRKEVEAKFERLPLRFYDSRTHGEILSRVVNDMDSISSTLQQNLTQLITSILTLVGVVAMMLTISVVLAVVVVLTLPLSLAIVGAIAKRSKTYFMRQQKALGELNGHVAEMYAGHTIVTAFGHEERSVATFEALNAKYYEGAWRAQFVSGIIWPSMMLVGNLGYVFVAVIGGVLRFYDVNAGSIRRWHGHQRSGEGWPAPSVGMVLQDTWLFPGTIRDNIAYGRDDATEEAVVKAARAAQADHFIRTLPENYDTIIKEATNLSQGQKQLLTIARAFLADPAIILDEATSSVDTRTEVLIQKAMREMMQGRTTFVIAHRLSTIRNADSILMIEHGRIVEQGPHEGLLAANGRYAELYHSQFAGRLLQDVQDDAAATVAS